jgi:hypothetical protein
VLPRPGLFERWRRRDHDERWKRGLPISARGLPVTTEQHAHTAYKNCMASSMARGTLLPNTPFAGASIGTGCTEPHTGGNNNYGSVCRSNQFNTRNPNPCSYDNWAAHAGFGRTLYGTTSDGLNGRARFAMTHTGTPNCIFKRCRTAAPSIAIGDAGVRHDHRQWREPVQIDAPGVVG